LAAAGGLDLSVKEKSSDVNTVGESALLADAGPAGGLADVSGNDFEHGQIQCLCCAGGRFFWGDSGYV